MRCCRADQYGWCAELETGTATECTGARYCHFHAPMGEKGLSTEDFNRQVYERLSQAMQEGVECNLAGTVFEGDISFRKFKRGQPLPAVNLADAVFHGEVSFYRNTFSGPLCCRGAEFRKEALFIMMDFYDKVDFCFTRFCRLANFSGNRFRDKVEFSDSTFGEAANFYFGEFNHFASFRRTVFNGEANFSEARFEGPADFMHTVFNGESHFFLTRFYKELICEKGFFVESV